jgi:hypothetical protein
MTSDPPQAATAPTALPEELPIFPIAGVLLLPRGRVPLNVSEPRDLAMVEDALGHGRLIGIIQPASSDDKTPVPVLYKVGCAGRITSFAETDDNHFLISLSGVCRFAVAEELPQRHGYRRIRPDWRDYLNDVGPVEDVDFDRARLMNVLRQYFKTQGIATDWAAVQNASCETLVSSLAVVCPFEPSEKQALLEAPDLEARVKLLIALLEMASLPQRETESARH